MAEVILLSYILKHYDSDLLKFNIEKHLTVLPLSNMGKQRKRELVAVMNGT